MKEQKLDILAIGVHPDDVELGCGGTLIKHVHQGYKVGILDLTAGELGTRGNAATRLKEAEKAAEIIGVVVRKNLQMRDGFFSNDENHQKQIIQILRAYKPDIVLANAPKDRHPDHGRAAELVRDACFLSGLPKVETTYMDIVQEAWRPGALYHYIQAYYQKPDFVVSFDSFYEQKMKAILAYTSQFYGAESKEPETFISSPEFLDFVKARAMEFGMMIGAKYAEGFMSNRYIGVSDLTHLQ